MLEHVDVTTTHGPVRGSVEDGVPTFRGVPYGGPVSGAGRWRPAAPPEPWTEPRDATVTGPRAVQVHGNVFQTRIGDYLSGGRTGALGLNDEVDDEDCLVLNVLTPSVDAGARPVLVYLHGGGFSQGSGALALGAQRFVAEQDVVLVSVNHRLGVLGHLYLGDLDEAYADSGNVGVLDVVLALRWVRDNAARFGGDPGCVTVFGESGGGAKVSTLLAMPAARGLLHRAVVQSGPYLRARTVEDAARVTRGVLGRLGVDPHDPAALAAVPARDLVRAAPDSWVELAPVADGRSLAGDPFGPEALDLSRGVPLLIGHCRDEMHWLADVDHLDDRTADGLLGQMVTAQRAEEVRAVYRAEGAPDGGPPTPRDVYLAATTDAFVSQNVTRIAERASEHGEDVFRYVFTYPTPVEGGRYRAFHTAELPLALRLVRYPGTDGLSRTIAAAWAAFARTGDPSGPGLAWPRYDRRDRATAVLDLEPRVAHDPDRARRRLWERLPSFDPWVDEGWGQPVPADG